MIAYTTKFGGLNLNNLKDLKSLSPLVILLQNFGPWLSRLLRGYYTPNLKLACFVCYLKINNTFLKNNVCVVKQFVQVTTKKMALKF